MKTAKLITTTGLASLWRKETFNGGTTPKIEWIVTEGVDNHHVRSCTTRKEAMNWFLMVSFPKN